MISCLHMMSPKKMFVLFFFPKDFSTCQSPTGKTCSKTLVDAVLVTFQSCLQQLCVVWVSCLCSSSGSPRIPGFCGAELLRLCCLESAENHPEQSCVPHQAERLHPSVWHQRHHGYGANTWDKQPKRNFLIKIKD